MKRPFTLGAVSGIAALALAVPILAQVTGAQTANDATSSTDSSTTPKNMFWNRPATTEEGIQTMIERDDAFLANADAITTLLKSRTQTHRDALTAAASISDATEREAAVRAANEAFHTSMQEFMEANPDLQGAMHMGFGGKGHGMMMGKRGQGPEMLATKLGLTEEELKTAFDSGKTIEQIAEEKGITLPDRPMMGKRIFKGEASSN